MSLNAQLVVWTDAVSSARYYGGVSICFAYFELQDGALCCLLKVFSNATTCSYELSWSPLMAAAEV